MHGPPPPILDVRWSPEALIIMGVAYELTLHRLGNPGIDLGRQTREHIARLILQAAAADQEYLDAEQLSEAALAELGKG